MPVDVGELLLARKIWIQWLTELESPDSLRADGYERTIPFLTMARSRFGCLPGADVSEVDGQAIASRVRVHPTHRLDTSESTSKSIDLPSCNARWYRGANSAWISKRLSGACTCVFCL